MGSTFYMGPPCWHGMRGQGLPADLDGAPPGRRSQFRGGEKHISNTNRGSEGTHGGTTRRWAGPTKEGRGGADIMGVPGKKHSRRGDWGQGQPVVSWELEALRTTAGEVESRGAGGAPLAPGHPGLPPTSLGPMPDSHKARVVTPYLSTVAHSER